MLLRREAGNCCPVLDLPLKIAESLPLQPAFHPAAGSPFVHWAPFVPSCSKSSAHQNFRRRQDKQVPHSKANSAAWLHWLKKIQVACSRCLGAWCLQKLSFNITSPPPASRKLVCTESASKKSACWFQQKSFSLTFAQFWFNWRYSASQTALSILFPQQNNRYQTFTSFYKEILFLSLFCPLSGKKYPRLNGRG